MKLAHANDKPKGWSFGTWNSNLQINIGFANQGLDEPHVHTQIHEIYLVARGESEIRIEQQTVKLIAGDILVLEPGEAHTFISSSADYFHFVVHSPGLTSESVKLEKRSIEKRSLGLVTDVRQQ